MWKKILSKKMAVCLCTGFASGLPLYFLYQTLPVWFRDNQMDLKTIAIFALVSNPYTLKFLWAPVFDHFQLPFGGRRRGWTFLIQVLLVVNFAAFSMFDPTEDVWWVAGLSFIVAFLSACQDIVLDAYRREILDDDELGLGSSLFTNAYRFSSLVPGSLALILADVVPWSMVHLMIAGFMALAILSTWWMDEPDVTLAPRKGVRQAVVEPFLEFFQRSGVRRALLLLAFMLLYKLGDSMATALASPFYLDLGFTKSQIGSVAKVASLWSTVVGSLIGGLVMLRVGIGKALWLFGIVQVVSIFGFYVLAKESVSLPIAEARSIQSFKSMSDFAQRVVLPKTIRETAHSFLHVRTYDAQQCAPTVVPCGPRATQSLVYLNELEQDALATLELPSQAPLFKPVEVERLLAARRQGDWPRDLTTLQTIVGRKLAAENLFFVFQVRGGHLKAEWFVDHWGLPSDARAHERLSTLLDSVSTLNRADQLLSHDLFKGLTVQSRARLDGLLEMKTDVNTASMHDFGRRPPMQPDPWLLFWVVSFEYLGVGLGTAAFVAFISSITNRQFTATQFALLTSVAAVPRTFINATTGILVQSLGYASFFLLCAGLALPGMVLLWWVAPLGRTQGERN